MKNKDLKRYIVSFIITALVFGCAILLSSYFSAKKIESLNDIQDNISLDILSTETQFALLEELACKDVDNTALSEELAVFADKIAYSEENIGDKEQVEQLKKFYSLLQIKDYLLMKNIRERCGADDEMVVVLYFYTTEANCSECAKQGYALTDLRDEFPNVRVYSFDYSLDLSAVRSLISIFKIEDTKLPALIINDEVMTGFQSTDDIVEMIPSLAKARAERIEAEENATSSSATSSKK